MSEGLPAIYSNHWNEKGAGGYKTSSSSLMISLWRSWKSWQASGTCQDSPEERWKWLGSSVKKKCPQPCLDLSIESFLQVHKGTFLGWAWDCRHSITSLCMRSTPNLTPTASYSDVPALRADLCLEWQLWHLPAWSGLTRTAGRVKKQTFTKG